jgi:hypothetical protein
MQGNNQKPTPTLPQGSYPPNLTPCEWFKRYGPVHLWVTDQGAHFKNRAVSGVQKVWGAEHHFVTAYCPWANGSVEVVNRVLLKVLKSMLSERKLKPVEWTKVIAWVQSSLNFSPSSRLGACAAITAFLGLSAPSPVKTPFVEYVAGDLPTVDNVSWSKEVLKNIRLLQESMDLMHKEVVQKTKRKNERERQRQLGKSSLPNLDVGDFVLVGRAVEVPNKLALQWRGPCRVVRAVSKWVFEVQDLFAPFKTSVAHVSRLQFYADAQRGHMTDLVEYAVAHQDFFLVETLLECRQANGQWEILVKWLGFDVVEATWEPLEVLLTDVPALVRQAVHDLTHPWFKNLPNLP